MQTIRSIWARGAVVGVLLGLTGAACAAASWLLVSEVFPGDAARPVWIAGALVWGPLVIGGVLRHLEDEGLDG